MEHLNNLNLDSNFFSRGSLAGEIPGVYTLPRTLTLSQIGDLLGLRELRCHHSDEEGHSVYYEEDDIKDDKKKKEPKKEEKEKEDPKIKEASPALFRADKPHKLPWVAELLWSQIPNICINGLRPYKIDEYMQLYRLVEGAGRVPPHVDEDFLGPDGSVALCSILLYLNDEYCGGETLFNGSILAPQVQVGGGLLFNHNILHEGLMVLSGEKFVLKTDLFFR